MRIRFSFFSFASPGIPKVGGGRRGPLRPRRFHFFKKFLLRSPCRSCACTVRVRPHCLQREPLGGGDGEAIPGRLRSRRKTKKKTSKKKINLISRERERERKSLLWGHLPFKSAAVITFSSSSLLLASALVSLPFCFPTLFLSVLFFLSIFFYEVESVWVAIPL